MRRRDRLAEILAVVRDGRLHRAEDLAGRLEVSRRTIYRDMEALVDSGYPIEGERGVGYLLREPVRLPAVDLSFEELEALQLGMRIVGEAADPEMQRAARSLLRKLGHVASPGTALPRRWGFGVYPFERARDGFAHMPVIRRAVREQRKLRLEYLSLRDVRSRRVVRPLQIEYWGRVWTLTAWCECRNDFRAFRIDRLERCETMTEHFEDEPGRRLEDYLVTLESRNGAGGHDRSPGDP